MDARILYLTHTASIGGAENNLLRLLQAWSANQISTAVLLPQDGPLVKVVKSLGVPVGLVPYYSFQWRNPFRYLQTLGTLLIHVLRFQADVIHLNHQCLVEFAVQAGRLSHRPVVCHIRNLLQPQDLTPLLSWLMKADAIVGVSYAVLAPLRTAGIPEDRLHLIPNGLDLARLLNARHPRILHQELRLPATTRLVGVLGRVVPEKGIEVFLAAAEIISRQQRDVHFVVVGEDWEQGAYVRRLKEHLRQIGLDGRVTFTGFRTDIPDILADLEVVVTPSRSDMPEGLPNTVLEALAVGDLVVATRNSGTPEIIQDGVNGFLVDCDDTPGLAQAILKALTLSETDRRMMRQAAQESVKDRTIENQVQQLGELYHSLVRGKFS